MILNWQVNCLCACLMAVLNGHTLPSANGRAITHNVRLFVPFLSHGDRRPPGPSPGAAFPVKEETTSYTLLSSPATWIISIGCWLSHVGSLSIFDAASQRPWPLAPERCGIRGVVLPSSRNKGNMGTLPSIFVTVAVHWQ